MYINKLYIANILGITIFKGAKEIILGKEVQGCRKFGAILTLIKFVKGASVICVIRDVTHKLPNTLMSYDCIANRDVASWRDAQTGTKLLGIYYIELNFPNKLIRRNKFNRNK